MTPLSVEKADYSDLLKLFDPRWFDEMGVPRNTEFHPSYLARPRAKSSVRAIVACQVCDKRAIVAISSEHDLKTMMSHYKEGSKFNFNYGDMPVGFCCDEGSRMQGITEKIIECWDGWLIQKDIK